jgi:HEAT repeat protein
MSELSEASRKVVYKLLDGDDQEREDALEELPTLPDKKSAADFLVERLATEQDLRTRSWIVSGLAAINEPDTVDAVAARLDPSVEEFEWARYFAAIGLARMKPDDLEQQLIKARGDPDVVVRMVASRLLIENGFENGYVEELLLTAEDPEYWNARWAACKVLRREAGHRPFREGLESKFIPVLERRLHDNREVADVRYQAARALANMTHESKRAIDALSRALKEELPDWVRRGCVDALAQIGTPETKEALLGALVDRDAEIRVRAAHALGNALEKPDAVDFIVEELLRQEQPPLEYFDALRQIDNRGAANVLSGNMRHPDPKMAERASRALIRLGGEEAVRTLQAERTEALKRYTELLGDADEQIMSQFNTLMRKAHQAFSMSMWMHGLIFAIGIGALMASLTVALSAGFDTFERFVGVGTAAGSLLTLLWLFYRDPLKNIRKSVLDLVEVNVVFLGYVRQINQIDATFKQMFLAANPGFRQADPGGGQRASQA